LLKEVLGLGPDDQLDPATGAVAKGKVAEAVEDYFSNENNTLVKVNG